jgi:hypothetical protein
VSASSRFAGFVILDECPVQATETLGESVFVRPIGHLSPESYFDAITRMLSDRSWRPPDADRMFAATHPCAAIRFEEVPGDSAEEALTGLHASALPHVLSLAHRLLTPCRVLCEAVEDLNRGSILFNMLVGSAVPYFFYPEGGREFVENVLAVEKRSGHALLLLRAFRDFLSDDNPEYRVVKGWMTLELMADALGASVTRNRKGNKTLLKVAALVEQLETAVDNGLVFTKGTWEDEKLGFLAAVHQRRNCIVHSGRCDPAERRCKRRGSSEKRCSELEPLAKDLVLLLHSMLRSYLYPLPGVGVKMRPEGVELQLRGGRIVMGDGEGAPEGGTA